MNYLILTLLCFGFTALSVSAQVAEKAEDISPLLIGETIPNAQLKSPDGSINNVLNIIREKPTVLLFYRGGWCPFCNLHLSEIQGVQSEVIKLGYQIAAISPDSPENLQVTDEKQKLDYRLFSDADGAFIKAMGIAFKAPGKYAGMLNKSSGGQNEGFLPVPSVFVVDTSGKILFEYINPDYKIRLSAGLLLAVLKELKNEKSN